MPAKSTRQYQDYAGLREICSAAHFHLSVKDITEGCLPVPIAGKAIELMPFWSHSTRQLSIRVAQLFGDFPQDCASMWNIKFAFRWPAPLTHIPSEDAKSMINTNIVVLHTWSINKCRWIIIILYNYHY